jgi:hypothetical protein
MQVKASDRPAMRNDGNAVATRVEWRDIRAWCAEPMPVILILYDAQRELAYWLHVQKYFRDRRSPRMTASGQTTTVLLPCEQVLSEEAIRGFARLIIEEVLVPIQRSIADAD